MPRRTGAATDSGSPASKFWIFARQSGAVPDSHDAERSTKGSPFASTAMPVRYRCSPTENHRTSRMLVGSTLRRTIRLPATPHSSSGVRKMFVNVSGPPGSSASHCWPSHRMMKPDEPVAQTSFFERPLMAAMEPLARGVCTRHRLPTPQGASLSVAASSGIDASALPPSGSPESGEGTTTTASSSTGGAASLAVAHP